MMIRTSTLLLYVLAFFFPFAVVNANEIVQILFDKDHANACNDNEWWQIDNAIYVLSQQRRSLRGDTEAQENISVDHMNRALWPNYCPNQCAGYAERTCKALNCKGFRNRSMIETIARGLFWQTTCENQINELTSLLNDLRNNGGFSNSCKWYLGLYQAYNCFTDQYCGTEGPPPEVYSSRSKGNGY